MNYLAFDTSGSHLTVVVKFNGKTYCQYLEDCKLQHSVLLMPTVEKVLQESGATVFDMDFFACCVGAGSFTGIRIGVATAKAFSFATGKPVLGVTSFEIMAYNNLAKDKVLTIIDARHDHFYACGFENKNQVIEPSYLSYQEVLNLSESFSLVSATEIEGFSVTTVNLKDGFINALEAKENSASFNRETLVPLYIRKSQAEEGL